MRKPLSANITIWHWIFLNYVLHWKNKTKLPKIERHNYLPTSLCHYLDQNLAISAFSKIWGAQFRVATLEIISVNTPVQNLFWKQKERWIMKFVHDHNLNILPQLTSILATTFLHLLHLIICMLSTYHSLAANQLNYTRFNGPNGKLVKFLKKSRDWLIPSQEFWISSTQTDST